MIKITMEEWKKIHKDYKGKDVAGNRVCFAGCIAKGGGTGIATEGINFTIVKEKSNEGKS